MEREEDRRPCLGAVEMLAGGHSDAMENAESARQSGCSATVSFFSFWRNFSDWRAI
jgi:hypothetical protein